MYRISRFESVSATRYLVHLEGGEFFPLNKTEAERYGIRKGVILTEEAYHEIMDELLPKKVCKRAMYYLLKMDRTESQLRKKLRDSLYPDSLIDYAIDYVKSFHYIDDVRYAAAYIEYRRDSRSRRQLVSELKGKGVSSEDIEKAFEQTGLPDEEDQIRYWQEKRHYRPEEADWKEREKFYQFLMRKGFSLSAIRKVLG